MRIRFIGNGMQLLVLGVLFLGPGGCAPDGVREDRSINYSDDGESVSFQHGQEGVFVASGKGDGVEKIFDAQAAIAVSSPLWSPVDKRLIFTVARAANPQSPRPAAVWEAWDADPAGRRFQAQDIVYTCMLRPDVPDQSPEPVPLFEAACRHPGYVAANLAVRWHPDGERVLFVDRVQQLSHSLFEFHLASGQRRRVLPAAGEALIFDWSPQRQYLLCVLSSDPSTGHAGGIWIRDIDGDQWWHVPASDQLAAAADSSDLLERLRATQPAWTHDDQRLAFVVQVAGNEDQEAQQDILAVQMESREVSRLYGSSRRLGGLQWHPDGKRLGFVEGEGPAALRMIGPDGAVSAPVTSDNVRQFAGWNHDGTRLAYITPETVRDSAAGWALLFPRVPEARDRVWIMNGDASGPSRLVHAGVRITFPQWSPKSDEISLWGTYTPTHRSWLSIFVPWTLRPGDPAAILSCATGEIQWMAVNAHEEAQVAHYYLLKRNYGQAWKWYQRSAQDREPMAPLKISELNQFLQQVRIHQNPTFFEYYCLTKLNRPREAAVRLQQFRDSMRFDLEDAGQLLGLTRSADAEQQSTEIHKLQVELRKFAEFAVPLLQAAYATEVFLSLDASADGVDFFRRELECSKGEAERLAASLCLSQLLLATGNHRDYATLATETLLPLLMKTHKADELDLGETMDFSNLLRWVQQVGALGSGALALLPLMSSEFLDGFSRPELESLLNRYEQLRRQAHNNDQRMVVDVCLLGILAQLGSDEQWEEVKSRVMTHPWLKGDDPPIKLSTRQAFSEDVDRIIQQIRDWAP